MRLLSLVWILFFAWGNLCAQTLRPDSLPEGTYTVVVSDMECVKPDTTAAEIVTTLLLTSEIKGRVEDPTYYLQDTPEAKRAADLLMLTQGWRRYDMASILSDTLSKAATEPFETSQSIAGHIEKEFDAEKPLSLRLFVPGTGYEETHRLTTDNRFVLNGLDFVDGTTYILQATSHKNTKIQDRLVIDTLAFPLLNGFGLHSTMLADVVERQVEEMPYSAVRVGRLEFELPEVKVRGRKIKPMNRMGKQPHHYIVEEDSLFEWVTTMNTLVSQLHMGINVGEAFVKIWGAEEPPPGKPGKYGHETLTVLRRRIGPSYEPVNVVLNGDSITEHALQEIPNLNPQDIKQMEFFLPNTLWIWTKKPTDPAYWRYNRPPSLQTVHQLGYKPPVEFYVSPYVSAYDAPTLYWNPRAVVKKKGALGITLPRMKAKRYLLTIEGVTNEGEIVHQQVELTPNAGEQIILP